MSAVVPLNAKKKPGHWMLALPLMSIMGVVFFLVWSPIEIVPSTQDAHPIISAHRGGRHIPDHPENALETFSLILDKVPGAWIECDISISKDSVLFLLHDASLDRTTTGTGRVERHEWQVIDTCHLVDDFGKTTPWKIPTLAQTLAWAKAKNGTLTLDIKRGVPFAHVINEVEEAELTDQCIIIVYSAADALAVHQLNPNIRISTAIRNEDELQRHLELGLPLDRLYAFVGTRLPSQEHLQRLKELKVATILGSLGNLDQQAEARGDHLYCTWGEQFDVLATDRPVAAYEALQSCP